ncbi:MAG: GerAB/ArcD/ProY family transporter [Clostridiaceae bacterium]
MNKAKNVYLTPSQFTIKLLGALIGVGILYIPNTVIKGANQDGWMACIIGALYPLYIVILASYMCKKYPGQNILILSKKCFGSFLGNILNLIFLSFFLFIGTTVFAGFANVFRIYATSFLKGYQIFFAALVPATFIVFKGLKAFGRMSEVIFYLVIIIVIIPFGVVIYGSILNLMPVFGNGVVQIIKASKETAFSYGGMEFIFLIYPFLEDKKKLFRCGVTSIVFTMVVYTWTAVLTIYYLGIDIAPKYLWPVLALTDSIKIPLINSFRYIFVGLWAIIAIKCVSTNYFAVAYGLNTIIKKISLQNFALLLYPVIIFLALCYGNETVRRDITGKLVEKYVIFNLTYATMIALIIRFKRGGAIEKK